MKDSPSHETPPETGGGCRHGWRGSAAEAISTRCPACGMAALFIGTGGHITCANLKCPEPGLGSEINNLRAAIEEGLLTLVAIAAQPATAGRLWGENPTLGATLARLRKATRRYLPIVGPRTACDGRSNTCHACGGTGTVLTPNPALVAGLLEAQRVK